MKNQLSQSFSPYLLQHAQNPVHWKIWNNENIAQAKKQNKLMIISIGYAACHWCHVMEKECFEDAEVADVMNHHFLSYKIDREERPAVDAYYMQALQLMTKQGGWPLNIVALPNGLPVWGATYVPKAQWIDVLQQLAALFESDPDKMYDYAQQLNNGIALTNNTLEIYPKDSAKKELLPLIENWTKSFDMEFGGYQRAPKFMMPTNLNFLYRFGQLKKRSGFTNHVENTLTKMAYGGLFDVIEGGFSRYSVDHKWHIPHFEKMLYDNAQLLSTYTNAYLATQNPLYKEIVSKTASFILTHWHDISGGFYSAYDADSLNANRQLQEGAYYFWDETTLKSVIPEQEWQLFSTVFSINRDGYWDEAKAFVLFQKDSLEDIATNEKISLETLKLLKSKWEVLLLKKRAERENPLLDDKIIVSWNALLLSGLLDAQKIIPSQKITLAIKGLVDFLQNKAYRNDALGRAYKNNQVYIEGTLEDYAFTIKSFIDLFNHSQDIAHLKFALDLTYKTLDLFFDTDQQFFKAASNTSTGTVFDIEDNVIPSSNAIMSRNLFYLGFLYKNEYFLHIGKEMTQRVLNQVDYASAFSEWLLNDLIFREDFEYYVVKNPTQTEIELLNKSLKNGIILNNSLNIPILEAYKNQNMKFQICNLNSCRLQSNDIYETIKHINL